MSDPFLGEIRMFAGNFAPKGWAFCNGQLLSISSNTALFSLLGTYYGGNGTTTFGLPNLQSRVAIHQGQGTGLSPYTIGQMGGTENVTLNVGQMPSHNHMVNCSQSGRPNTPAGNFPGSDTATGIYNTSSDGSVMAAAMIANQGGNQPHPNIQPYQCVSFIIALQGIYPSRN